MDYGFLKGMSFGDLFFWQRTEYSAVSLILSFITVPSWRNETTKHKLKCSIELPGIPFPRGVYFPGKPFPVDKVGEFAGVGFSYPC